MFWIQAYPRNVRNEGAVYAILPQRAPLRDESAAGLAYAYASDVGVEALPSIARLACRAWRVDHIAATVEGSGSGGVVGEDEA